MWEKLGWFAIAYACISLTVTVVMLVVANKAFKLGGPIGMVRSAFILVLVVVGFIVWATKKATGYSPPGESANDQIKRTIRKTSSWLDGLKHEWDDAKSGDRSQLPGPRDRDQR
ncbi:MAG: hypothetical protein HZB38_00130 [Planctomycetes bacterium]|nr:hypothetical protein [Planctomycetota bacterium]